MTNELCFPCNSDVPSQMPPLTPGTNKKMSEVLKASFASWEKEVQDRCITKGKFICAIYFRGRFDLLLNTVFCMISV